jgi:hypothetical protein
MRAGGDFFGKDARTDSPRGQLFYSMAFDTTIDPQWDIVNTSPPWTPP